MSASRYKNRIRNLLMPAVFFGGLTGAFTSLTVMLYKLCAGKIIRFSEHAYGYMQTNPLYIACGVAVICLAAFLYKSVLSKRPNVRGGGIPTSIAQLRGIISCNWVVNIVYVFLMSLLSFLIGVPLGNEGPSVQMGTASGKGVINVFAKKQAAYSRYAMTGGACAGFSIATGAPISGMMFAVEEAHQRISPMIILVSAVSVLFANITAQLLAPVFGVSTSLFEFENALKVLAVGDYWLPLLVGGVLGIFAVIFLKTYKAVNRFTVEKLGKIPYYLRILFVLTATMAAGIVSYDFISTGHELTLHLFKIEKSILLLLAILVVRSLLTLLANTGGITGGIFLPIISLGAVVSGIIGTVCVKYCGLNEEFYTVILVLGICGCISGMMKMPLTAVFFGVEALACYENIIPVIIVAASAYAITEVFGAESINDSVIAARVNALNEQGAPEVFDTHITVEQGSFAVGKQVRDIFWPNNLFVLSVKREESKKSELDEHGEKHIHPGDILHVRYSTRNKAETEKELIAIVKNSEKS